MYNTEDAYEIRNQGQIAKMTLPTNWSEDIHCSAQESIATLRSFSPEGEDTEKICFYYRGAPIGMTEGQDFNTILNTPSHALADEEIEAMGNVIRKLSNHNLFEMYSAETLDINGRRLLCVSGQWKDSQSITRHFFINCDDSGRIIQEVFFLAPCEKFLNTLPIFLACLQTVEWEQEVTS